MAGNGDIMDGIEPCRTCGIFYLTASNFLRKIFDASNEEQNLSNIRTELSAWSIQITQDDGLPQYICTCCILEFQKLFKFRELCVDLQTQWRHFYQIREENKIFIKKELPDPDEKNGENITDFIYVDDLSDNEYADGGGGGCGNFTPFSITHIPIKEEPQENYAIPKDGLLSTERDTFNAHETLDQVEATEETNNSNELMEMSNLNLNALTSPKHHQLLDEIPSDNTSMQVNQEDYATTIECNLCLHVSANAEMHRQHMQRIHEIKDMDCHICGKQFKNSTATRLKYHLKWHRISKHIKCAQCGFFCDSRETLKEHVRAMHSKIECKTCGKRVLGKKMKVHMRTHEDRQWPCSYCNDVFSTEDSLESHIWEIHAQEDTQPIAVAAEEINTSDNLQKAEKEEPLACSICNQLSPNELELNAHMLQCHVIQNVTETETFDAAEPETETHQFNYQDATVLQTSVTNLDIIKQDITTEVNDSNLMLIQQHQQTKSFNSNNNKEVTQVISSDEEAGGKSGSLKEYACPKCPQKFTSTADLCCHFQDHLEKSEFGCYLCGKSFKIKFSLNRHLKRHK
ncbi:oocyte zinc finger protein XlCOF6 [Eurosta solidaginis]|uniref:oocyte zinc finger protein XlCOF6 n=1 Tax=Eurosta solidaginis TaxID=178769 RepID=UPI00353135BE